MRTISVAEDAAEALLKAVADKWGRVRGRYSEEASKALRAHARRLAEEDDERGDEKDGASA